MLTGYEFEMALISREWEAYRDSERIWPHDLKIGTNSVDITLSPFFRRVLSSGKNDKAYIDIDDANSIETEDFSASQLIIYPGDFYLGRTRERFETSRELTVDGQKKKYIQMCHGRSSLARVGILIHGVAGFGDYGFNNYWTLEIFNVNSEPVMLKANKRIGQICFDAADGSMGQRTYQGPYNQIQQYPGAPEVGEGRI